MKENRSEFDVMLNLSREELIKITDAKIADLILKNREGKIKVSPGYDGEYGIPLLDESKEGEAKNSEKIVTKARHMQKGLDEFL